MKMKIKKIYYCDYCKKNEKFLLGEIQKMKKEQITEGSVIDKEKKA